MGVLVEGISVIVRRDAFERYYPGGTAGYESDAPNETYCDDEYLTRVGFSTPPTLRVTSLAWKIMVSASSGQTGSLTPPSSTSWTDQPGLVPGYRSDITLIPRPSSPT